MRIQNMEMISEWSGAREGRCYIIFKSQAVLLDRRPSADGKFSLAAALRRSTPAAVKTSFTSIIQMI
jgi:hypothetical protein